jgi:hypothetical protein
MNAWAPKTNRIVIATEGVVVRASPRWVNVSTTRPTRMIDARLACRSSQS